MADIEVVDLDEGSGDIREVSNKCLVGKIISSKVFNVLAVTNTLKAAWKTRATFSVVPWNNNTFLFRFEEEEDQRSILSDGPWSVMNNLLVLHNLVNGLAVPNYEFNSTPFWVQIHGLPVERMSRANAEIIGRRFDKLLGVEAPATGLLLHRSFLRVRVEININQPLPKGFWLRGNSATGKDLWISYMYEKLPDYCYACGRLGHENRVCKLVSREEGQNSGYGPALRTGRARKSEVPIEQLVNQVEEDENRIENLVPRRPESQLGDRGAREISIVTERVKGPCSPQGDPVGVLSEDRGAASRVTGIPLNTPSNSISHSSAILSHMPTGNSYLCNDITIPNGPVPSQPTPLALINSLSQPIPLPTIKLHPKPTISPFSTTPQSGPQYYVTEPTDSPKSPHIRSLPFNPTQPNIIDISPNHSPTQSPSKENQPNPKDLSLTCVFQNLAIKRKAQEEPDFSSKPKILRICEPEPKSQLLSPSPKSSLPRSNRKPTNPRIPKSSGKKCTSKTDGLQLFDVHILSAPENLLMDEPMAVEIGLKANGAGNMQNQVHREMGVNPASSERVVVADPKQPQARC